MTQHTTGMLINLLRCESVSGWEVVPKLIVDSINEIFTEFIVSSLCRLDAVRIPNRNFRGFISEWVLVWQGALEQTPEFHLPLRFLKVALDFTKHEDPQELLPAPC